MGDCATCENYGDFEPRSGGTPPWPVCRFRAKPETCGARFKPRNPPWPSWLATSPTRDEAEYTERVIALMTPEQKASLETLRIRLGARSAAEVIRMLIEKEMKETKP